MNNFIFILTIFIALIIGHIIGSYIGYDAGFNEGVTTTLSKINELIGGKTNATKKH